MDRYPWNFVCGLSLGIVLTISIVCASNPERLGKKEPDISGESNWGTVTQKGKTVTLEGHPLWIATGEIRADGKLKLQWIELATGRPAPSLYTIKGNDITGEWGWLTDTQWLENGDLVGDLRPDAIVRK